MKRNHSSDSSTSIEGNVSIGGDGAIGKNSKIVKSDKKLNKFEIAVGIATIVGVLIGIYQFLKGNGN